MWAIKILSGAQAGHSFPLKHGPNTLGRAPSCDIKIISPGVSKEHIKIESMDGKLILTDLGSRNGTFVNGVQVKSTQLRLGDKVALHDIFIEVIHEAPLAFTPSLTAFSQQPSAAPHAHHAYQGNTAYQIHHNKAEPHLHMSTPADYPEHSANPSNSTPNPQIKDLNALLEKAREYLDTVVLPGAYKLPEMLEFKWVLALFMTGFILLVTGLSTVPLLRILKSSIEQESQQHALTIASALANTNRSALMQGMDSAVSVDGALRRPGVKAAYIVSNIDGNIIAPASQAGSYPDMSFIHEARRRGRETVSQINSNTVGAIVPIEFYNPETGSQAVTAHAVVIYDMAAHAIDDGKTISLFIQTLFIALIIGSVLFFFMYKIIEFPLRDLNTQLNQALKDGTDTLTLTYDFPVLRQLISNISSALSRAVHGSSSDVMPQVLEHDRRPEMTNLVDMVGFAAASISALDSSFVAMNPQFEERTGLNSDQHLHTAVDNINDQALKLSLKDLLDRVVQFPDQIATNELEFSGDNYQVAVQAIYGSDKIAYFLVVLVPVDIGGDYE